jgi:hypothetical protein
MKIPNKYKNASLMDINDCDYISADIVNYVLADGEAGEAYNVSDLTDKQCRIALSVILVKHRETLKRMEKISDIALYNY